MFAEAASRIDLAIALGVALIGSAGAAIVAWITSHGTRNQVVASHASQHDQGRALITELHAENKQTLLRISDHVQEVRDIAVSTKTHVQLLAGWADKHEETAQQRERRIAALEAERLRQIGDGK